EGLLHDVQPNPVQQAMIACQGAQCGFCTPGFVVSLTAMFEQRHAHPATPREVQAACIGNLCRCTGYEPIVRAGAAVDPSTMRPLDQLFPPQPIAADLARHSADPVEIRADGKLFFKPTSLAAASQFKARHADAMVISGGTDVGVQLNKCLR